VRARYVERWGLSGPAPGRVSRAAWHIGLLSSALEDAMARNPHWHVVEHEALCLEPEARLGALFSSLGLEWSESTQQLLADDDRPGSGFAVQRRRSEVPGSWRTRLDGPAVADLTRTLDGFPHQQWWRAQDWVPPASVGR